VPRYLGQHDLLAGACRFHATELTSMARPVVTPTEIIELTTLRAPKRTTFGEFLVARRIISRTQLFRALQMQDRIPNARLGSCAVALGYAPRHRVEELYAQFVQAAEAELETMRTEAFRKDEIEVV